jgi:hypothetical protein
VKLLFPQNIFTRLIADHLPEPMKESISFHPSSVLSKELSGNEDAVGLIPVMDLVSHKDFFISSKAGLSFESMLCNSYLYFNTGGREVKDVYLTGDVSSQEVILSKIIFKEQYDAEVEMHLLADNNTDGKNLIITGDKNFNESLFPLGISLADEMTDNLNLPYVNFMFAANKKENIELLNAAITGMDDLIYDDVENYNFGELLPDISRDYIKTNISSLIVNFDQQDIEGLEQLIRLPYFYGMIKDIIDIKFV